MRNLRLRLVSFRKACKKWSKHRSEKNITREKLRYDGRHGKDDRVCHTLIVRFIPLSNSILVRNGWCQGGRYGGDK
jgi:hypothetical protein